jgi:outer membrane protein assembly factor BamE (lipoprotein component of BamABCDE complex)
MKPITISTLLALCIALCGCSTMTNRVTTGRDFDETKVNQIQKGVTQAKGVIVLYGEPDTKEIVSASQIMWHYTYLTQMLTTHSGMFMPTVELVTGYKKNLDILLQDDTVINFAYVKVPIQSEKQISGAVITN